MQGEKDVRGALSLATLAWNEAIEEDSPRRVAADTDDAPALETPRVRLSILELLRERRDFKFRLSEGFL